MLGVCRIGSGDKVISPLRERLDKAMLVLDPQVPGRPRRTHHQRVGDHLVAAAQAVSRIYLDL